MLPVDVGGSHLIRVGGEDCGPQATCIPQRYWQRLGLEKKVVIMVGEEVKLGLIEGRMLDVKSLD